MANLVKNFDPYIVFARNFCVFIFLFFSISVLSQEIKQIEIRGIVVEKKSQTPLPGASVVVTGEENGTLTEVNGAFLIRVKS
ncbi:MAG: carboxypeptidase-like regulatory domain-containing protein, partial [Bacteroidales bacterium]|nr:carboxypeptidase-like regulatory domain-containing protein [Bacteroidales bacterium]